MSGEIFGVVFIQYSCCLNTETFMLLDVHKAFDRIDIDLYSFIAHGLFGLILPSYREYILLHHKQQNTILVSFWSSAPSGVG